MSRSGFTSPWTKCPKLKATKSQFRTGHVITESKVSSHLYNGFGRRIASFTELSRLARTIQQSDHACVRPLIRQRPRRSIILRNWAEIYKRTSVFYWLRCGQSELDHMVWLCDWAEVGPDARSWFDPLNRPDELVLYKIWMIGFCLEV